ncbi:hypothetical protein [Candidatus Ichthyocystis hellenicum]|uniref:hypothetical protein n=1 Tax=Candidatus Ichthyocystis hellenicum TaxID=1561003 RepID=UPI000B81C159|nr:hypothetical protein [Candidatus Ichthyocystis hellenicum]
MDDVHSGWLQCYGANDVGTEYYDLHGGIEPRDVGCFASDLFGDCDVGIGSGSSISDQLLQEVQELHELQRLSASQESESISSRGDVSVYDQFLQETQKSCTLQGSQDLSYGHGNNFDIGAYDVGTLPTYVPVVNDGNSLFSNSNSVFADCNSATGNISPIPNQFTQGMEEEGYLCGYDLDIGLLEKSEFRKDVVIPNFGNFNASNSLVDNVSLSLPSTKLFLGDRIPANREDEGNIIKKVGLNIHPYYYSNIFHLKKSFLDNVKENLVDLFSSMLEREFVFKSGKVFSKCVWRDVYSELLPIAMESLEPIIDDTCEEIEKILSETYILDVCDDDSYRVARKITDDEKVYAVKYVKEFVIYKKLRSNIRMLWSSVVKYPKYNVDMGYRCRGTDASGDDSVIGGSWGVKLRYVDNVSILNIRRNFSSKIRSCVGNRFREMLKNNHKFEDHTIIDKSPWIKLSKKLIPIARDEIKDIIEEERKEIELVLSDSRVIVGKDFDRELTDEEKDDISESIIRLVIKQSNYVFRKLWENIIDSSEEDFGNVMPSAELDVNYEGTISSAYYKNGYHISDFFTIVTNDKKGTCLNFSAKLHHEDAHAISVIKSNFSRMIGHCISSKLRGMVMNEYKFDDGTVIGLLPWKEVSKKLSPVIEKEIEPIIEDEQLRINEVLLQSRLIVYSSNGCFESFRRVTPAESAVLLEEIFRIAYRKIRQNFRKSWESVVRSLKVRLPSSEVVSSVRSLPLEPLTFQNSDSSEKEVADFVDDDNHNVSVVDRDEFGILWRNVLKSIKGGSLNEDTNLSAVSVPCVPCSVEVDPSNVVGTDVEHFSCNFYGVDQSEHVQQIPLADMKMKYQELGIEVGKIMSEWGVAIDPSDYKYVLSAKEKFENSVVAGIRYFLADMVQKKFVIPSGQCLFKCSWDSVSEILYSILKDSMEFIINNAYEEFDAALLNARVVSIDQSYDSFCTVRRSTDNEKNDLIKRARTIVTEIFKSRVKLEWATTISSNLRVFEGIYYYDASSNSKINIRSADVVSILSVRRKFASKISRIIGDKFRKIAEGECNIFDGNVIGLLPWRCVSAKILPIAKKEVSSIMECERLEIKGILLKSLAVIYRYGDCSSVTRELTHEERGNFLEMIMASVEKRAYLTFTKIWRNLMKSLR